MVTAGLSFRGATLAWFRRCRPGRDRQRGQPEGYTAVTPASPAQTRAPARRQDHVGGWPFRACGNGSARVGGAVIILTRRNRIGSRRGRLGGPNGGLRTPLDDLT